MQLKEYPFSKVQGIGLWALGFDVFNVLLFFWYLLLRKNWQRGHSAVCAYWMGCECIVMASRCNFIKMFCCCKSKVVAAEKCWCNKDFGADSVAFSLCFRVSFVLKSNLQMIFVFMSNRISFHWKDIYFTMETNLKPWVILVSCSLLRRQSLNATLLGDIRKRPPQVSYEAIVEALIEARHWFGWLVL